MARKWLSNDFLLEAQNGYALQYVVAELSIVCCHATAAPGKEF